LSVVETFVRRHPRFYKTNANRTSVDFRVIFQSRCRAGDYFAEQDVGFQPAASGSFLKSVVVRYAPRA
jgi:hypothetical protein